MEKGLTGINKQHKWSNEEFGRWSPIPQREGVCSYARPWESAEKEQTLLIPWGRGMSRPSGSRRRPRSRHTASLFPMPTAQPFPQSLGTGSPDVRGTPSTTGNIPAALPVPSQRLPLSLSLA